MNDQRPYQYRTWPRPAFVDAALEDAVLDQLNSIPGIRCYSTCAGHGTLGRASLGIAAEEGRLTVPELRGLIRGLSFEPIQGGGFWFQSPKLGLSERLDWFADTVQHLDTRIRVVVRLADLENEFEELKKCCFYLRQLIAGNFGATPDFSLTFRPTPAARGSEDAKKSSLETGR